MGFVRCSCKLHSLPGLLLLPGTGVNMNQLQPWVSWRFLSTEPGRSGSSLVMLCDLTLAGGWQLLSEGNIDCEAEIQYKSRTSLTPLRAAAVGSPLSPVPGKC